MILLRQSVLASGYLLFLGPVLVARQAQQVFRAFHVQVFRAAKGCCPFVFGMRKMLQWLPPDKKKELTQELANEVRVEGGFLRELGAALAIRGFRPGQFGLGGGRFAYGCSKHSWQVRTFSVDRSWEETEKLRKAAIFTLGYADLWGVGQQLLPHRPQEARFAARSSNASMT